MAQTEIPADAAEIEAQIANGSLDVKTLAKAYAELRDKVGQTLVAVAGVCHPEDSANPLELARDDLESVVWTTQEATHEILYSAERIDEAVGQWLGDDETVDREALAKTMAENVTKLFESCNFQDLTGQRITFVTNTVNNAGAMLQQIVSIWGKDSFADIALPERAEIPEGEQLSGPDLMGNRGGVSQADIDRLFS